jgi:hypothetical protein
VYEILKGAQIMKHSSYVKLIIAATFFYSATASTNDIGEWLGRYAGPITLSLFEIHATDTEISARLTASSPSGQGFSCINTTLHGQGSGRQYDVRVSGDCLGKGKIDFSQLDVIRGKLRLASIGSSQKYGNLKLEKLQR